MLLPPEWLVEWTKYLALVITTIAAARALWGGARAFERYADQPR